nr:chorismate mutase [Gammaproteobacteria bacterium]
MSAQDLKTLRSRIDAIDQQLLELFNQRASCAIEVADAKKSELKEGESPDFFRPDREAQVIQRLKSLNKGPLSDSEIGRLIREVMSACLALE